MNISKKTSVFIGVVFLLVIALPTYLSAQQTSGKTEPKKEEKKKEDKQNPGKNIPPVLDKKATESDLKAPEESPEAVQDMTIGQGEVWNPENRRDPFASLIQKVAKTGGDQDKIITREGKRPDGIEGMDLKDIQLVGIFLVKGAYKAMFVGSDDYPYLLIVGNQIWDGRIKEIDFNCVTFEQEAEDPRFLVRRMKPVKRCLETE
jgi:Tfp pilus assembly protein PilP